MALRSVTGSPDTDLDHAEWQNGRAPSLSTPSGRPALALADLVSELKRILAPALGPNVDAASDPPVPVPVSSTGVPS